MKKRSVLISILCLFFSIAAMAKGTGHCSAHHVVVHPVAHHTDPWKTLLAQPHIGVATYDNKTMPYAIQYQANKLILTDSNDNHLKVSPGNLKLQRLTIYNANTALSLVRLQPDNPALYRVVHTGKLSIYDNALSYACNANSIRVGSIQLVYDGRVKPLHAFFNGRKRLVSYINKVYGTQLDYKNYTWDSLIAYIDRMG